MTEIRTLDIDQIRILIDWAAAEGWNPGLADAPAFQAADPGGFLGAFVNGRMVSGISVVAYDDHFGFLGLYICHPDVRGRGHGRAVWDAGMAYLGNRTIGLDGVPEQQDNYRRMGFVTQYETMRMVGTLKSAAAKHCHIEEIRSAAPLLDLDRTCFPAGRQAFLEAWIRPPHRGVLARRNGEVCGYLVVRECLDERKIGPLFAHDPEVALDLLGALDGPVQIDVPLYQASMLARLQGMAFRPSFGTARMYRGPAPAVQLERIFGVTTLELG